MLKGNLIKLSNKIETSLVPTTLQLPEPRSKPNLDNNSTNTRQLHDKSHTDRINLQRTRQIIQHARKS